MKKQIYLILSMVMVGLFFARQSTAQTAYPISPFVFTTPSPMIGPILPSSSFKLPSLGTASADNFVRVNSNGVFFTGGVSSTPSTTPGGSNTQVQVNQNGAFAGYPNFTFNSSTGLLDVLAISSTNALFINASSTNLFASALTFTTANGTSITSTNAFFTNLIATNVLTTNLTTTNASLTNVNFDTASGTSITTTNAFATNLGTTNFSATNGSFTNLTSTNLVFTNASGTNLTSTNAYFTKININTTTQLGTITQQGIAGTDPIRIISSTGAQMLALKASGQLVVGPNSLSQTGQFTIETPTTNDVALSFTNGVHYTFQLGRVAGTSGLAYIGGPSGTGLNLRADGTDQMFIRSGGKVGIGTSTPVFNFAVVGDAYISGTTTLNATTTINGPLTFTTASGTSITTTNAFFTNLVATTLNLTNLVFTNASGTYLTSTNAYFSNLVTTNATTTNLHIAGMLKDSTVSPGTAGDILISNGTSTRWYTGGGSCNPYNQSDCTLVDQPSYFIVVGATGCPEGWVLYKDDSTYTCSPNFVYDYFSYATPRLVLNADLSFLNATGTSLYLSDTISSTYGIFDTITTNNLVINNDITVNNLTVVDTATFANSTTITNEGVVTNGAIAQTYPENREGAFLTNVLTDPDVIQVGTPLSSIQAFYTDDTSRWLLCSNTAGTGAVSLKNNTLAPNNTLQNAFYDNAGNLQTITAATLFGAGYQIRGCLTMHGQHVVLGVSTTVGVSIKITTSSPTNNIASAANWRTATFTVATPSTSVISIAGVSRATGSNTEYIQIVSSTTKIVPATFDFSVNPPTISPDNSLTCTTGGSATLQNTRAYNGGLVVGNAGAPFVTVYAGCGAQTYNGSFGASAPSLTGPDLAVTKCSIYSLNGSALFRHSGYNGCEKPQF